MAVRKIRLQQVEVECAFCKGTGKDQFELMSATSTCQVCSGTGKRTLTAPAARCAYCGGSGIHPHSRLVCMTCRGAGQVSVPEQSVRCPGCAGTGKESRHVYTDSVLPCTVCGGRGVVDANSEAARSGK
jgi:DnaJ-class molecular chaperone